MWFGGHVLLVAVFGEERRDWPLWELFNFYFILLFFELEFCICHQVFEEDASRGDAFIRFWSNVRDREHLRLLLRSCSG